MGLVNKVVPFDRLEDECVEWAETMMERSPLALRMIKAGLNAELDGQAGIQELAGDATMLYYTMDEAQEGGRAFLEKRDGDLRRSRQHTAAYRHRDARGRHRQDRDLDLL